MATNLLARSSRGRLVERHWESRLDQPGGRRAKRGFAYKAYVPAGIGEADFALSSHIAAAASDAEQACRDLSDDPPDGLPFEALARQLLRAESVASSRIEGLVLSHRRLARAAFSEDGRDPTAQGVLANIAALELAVDRATQPAELNRADLVDVHRTLLAGTRDEHLGGIIREEQNWIGGAAMSPRGAEFIPPPHDLVPALLDDLCEFCNRVDVPAAIQAAIAHAQFETIHPFHDGNGRVGRTLILTILRRRGVAPLYLPPVSLVLAGHADRYIAGLTSWRKGDEEDWFAVFIDALQRSSEGAVEFAAAVAGLQERWIAKAGDPRRNSGPRQLILLLPGQPIVNVRIAAQLLGGTDERARQTILRLEQAGVLKQRSIGKRNRAWECVGLFELLDRFERDLGSVERMPRGTQ